MRILLIRPKPHKDTIGLQSIMVCEPLELEYLAAAVDNKHQVELVDMILEKQPLSFYIRKYQPELVGITGYIAHVNVIKTYANIIKALSPKTKVAVGGVHAEVVPEDFENINIDYIIAGNGVDTFAKLVEQLAAGDVPSGPSIVLGQGVEHTEPIPPVLPDRSISRRYRNRYYYVFHNPCALLKTSYGCPFTCNFCFCRQVTGGHYYQRELSSVIEELKQIDEPEIYIVDDNFLVDPQRVDEFCDLLKLHGIHKHFLIYGRADFITRHEKLIAKFAEAGLRAVIVGIESVNPLELADYHKQSTVEINEKAVQILESYGIDCYAALIIGLNWEDKDFHQLGLWLKKNNLRFINLQPFTPLPGTSLFAQYQNNLLIPRSKYEQWDLANLIVRPGKISVRRYYWNILKLYVKITLQPGNLLKNLKYGLPANLKLSSGTLRIMWQYMLKIIKGEKTNESITGQA